MERKWSGLLDSMLPGLEDKYNDFPDSSWFFQIFRWTTGTMQTFGITCRTCKRKPGITGQRSGNNKVADLNPCVCIFNGKRKPASGRTGHMITRKRHPVPACCFSENRLSQSWGGHRSHRCCHPSADESHAGKQVHVNIWESSSAENFPLPGKEMWGFTFHLRVPGFLPPVRAVCQERCNNDDGGNQWTRWHRHCSRCCLSAWRFRLFESQPAAFFLTTVNLRHCPWARLYLEIWIWFHGTYCQLSAAIAERLFMWRNEVWSKWRKRLLPPSLSGVASWNIKRWRNWIFMFNYIKSNWRTQAAHQGGCFPRWPLILVSDL